MIKEKFIKIGKVQKSNHTITIVIPQEFIRKLDIKYGNFTIKPVEKE